MRKFSVFFLLFSFWLINPTPASGCMCGTTTFSDSFKSSTAVFTATFLGEEYRKGIVNESIESYFKSLGQIKDYEVLVLKFKVESWWKGNVKQELIIVTNQGRVSNGGLIFSNCDRAFKKDQRYLVFASGTENKLQVSACSRTADIMKAKPDLKLLGKGKKPSA